MNNSVYIAFGILAAIYLGFSIINRKKSKQRKSRKFMEDYERKDNKKGDNP